MSKPSSSFFLFCPDSKDLGPSTQDTGQDPRKYNRQEQSAFGPHHPSQMGVGPQPLGY